MRAAKSTSLPYFAKFLSFAQSLEAKELLNVVLLTKKTKQNPCFSPQESSGKYLSIKAAKLTNQTKAALSRFLT